MTTTDVHNGYANRFLYVAAKRARTLPHGADLDKLRADTGPYIADLREALAWAQTPRSIAHDREAYDLWEQEYERLSSGHPGLFGAVTARAEAQVTRLALVYALLDCSPHITPAHLGAALALWRYCEASCRYIFGDRLGDPIADTLLDALRARVDGMTRTEISDLLGRNVAAPRIASALRALLQADLASFVTESTGDKGRPAERWYACPVHTKETK